MRTNIQPGRPLHPISVVSERTGLSADLLRVWERRYGVVEPARDEAGRRLYSDSDIERLRMLAEATAAGRNIGQLVELGTAELAELVRSDDVLRWERAGGPGSGSAGDLPGGGSGGGAEASFVERAFVCAASLDSEGLEAELSRAATVVGAARFMDAVIAPLFTRIGTAWHAGELGIAQEHMASGVAQRILARVRQSLPVAADAPVLVVGTPAGERHEIGGLLAAGAAALEGWRVMWLGADLPAADIAAAALEAGARMVALSTVYAEAPLLAAELRILRAALPGDVRIVIGGPGTAGLAGPDAVAGITILPDVSELRKRLAGGRR